MPNDDDRDEDATGDHGTHTVELDARVYEHVQAMGMPDESASDTLARLLGLTPDPATVAGDEFSTPLPDDPVVPDALASRPDDGDRGGRPRGRPGTGDSARGRRSVAG